MNAAMLMLVASTMATPQPAPNALSASPAFTMGDHVTFVDAAAPAPVVDLQTGAAGAKAKGKVGGKDFSLAIQGGLVTGIGTGFMVGVAASMQPGHNEHLELMADVNFGHVSHSNLFGFSFNAIYDFKKMDNGMMPFVGGGLSIFHYSFANLCAGIANCTAYGGTSANLQLIGGIQFKSNSPHVMRLSIRFLLNGGNPIIFLFGYSF